MSTFPKNVKTPIYFIVNRVSILHHLTLEAQNKQCQQFETTQTLKILLILRNHNTKSGQLVLSLLQSKMNDRDRRLNSIQSQLLEMYQDLFGSQYVQGLQATEKNQFNAIIQAFREVVYFIRQTQSERTQKQAKKGYKTTAQQLRINQTIREEIKKAEDILKEAVKRMKNDIKNQQKNLSKKIVENRQRMIKNCYQMLKDVQQLEEGGTYQPPQPKQTLEQIKKKLVSHYDEDNQINLEQEQALDRFKRKDNEIDQLLGEVINVNKEVQKQLIGINQNIDMTGEQIKNNMKKADQLDTTVKKATNDLAEVLKHYRKPNKLCLDIILILLILALIGVIINMIKTSA